MKTVRFEKVVEKSGQPEVYTLWSAPEKDAHLQSALKAQRVMSLAQSNVGSKKDFGEVGYQKGQLGVLLIFPKSLKAFVGLRVVGVKYELLEESEPAASPKKNPPAAKASRPVKKPRPLEEPKKKKAEPPKFEALRIFRAEEEEKEDPAKALEALRRQVKKALRLLAEGKAVPAYHLLQKELGVLD